jgi:hypothetical protein
MARADLSTINNYPRRKAMEEGIYYELTPAQS